MYFYSVLSREWKKFFEEGGLQFRHPLELFSVNQWLLISCQFDDKSH
jgi:hypothetical protein